MDFVLVFIRSCQLSCSWCIIDVVSFRLEIRESIVSVYFKNNIFSFANFYRGYEKNCHFVLLFLLFLVILSQTCGKWFHVAVQWFKNKVTSKTGESEDFLSLSPHLSSLFSPPPSPLAIFITSHFPFTLIHIYKIIKVILYFFNFFLLLMLSSHLGSITRMIDFI